LYGFRPFWRRSSKTLEEGDMAATTTTQQ
jgi:hypothetical protein